MEMIGAPAARLDLAAHRVTGCPAASARTGL